MLRYVHALSAFLFSLLAGAFFLAYILLHNDLMPRVAAALLLIGQLPLLVTGLLYGGLSVYRSLHAESGASRTVAIVVAVPLGLLFLLALYIHFA